MGLISRIQAKIEYLRLESRYTKRRNRRSQFVADAVYVDGEYVYSSPSSTGSSRNRHDRYASDEETSRDSSAMSSPTLPDAEEERRGNLEKMLNGATPPRSKSRANKRHTLSFHTNPTAVDPNPQFELEAEARLEAQSQQCRRELSIAEALEHGIPEEDDEGNEVVKIDAAWLKSSQRRREKRRQSAMVSSVREVRWDD
jgi:hypothetical protein